MVCITKAHVWYIKILAWLQGFLVIFLWSFDLFFFVLKSLLGIARQWSHEKFEFLTLKPRGHVRILIHQTWTIVIRQNKLMPRLCWSVLDQNDRSKCYWTLCTFKSTLGVWQLLHNHSTPLTVIKLTQRVKLRNHNTTAITKKSELLTIIF